MAQPFWPVIEGWTSALYFELGGEAIAYPRPRRDDSAQCAEQDLADESELIGGDRSDDIFAGAHPASRSRRSGDEDSVDGGSHQIPKGNWCSA